MHKKMETALFQMYRNLDAASQRQVLRGAHDQGARSQVTGGKHMNVIADVIRDDLISCGFKEDCVYYENGCLRLPGWFRPSKSWDLLAFEDENLLAAIELKSINSSFGNNANNRAEEALGSATDAAHAIKNELIPYKTVPPMLGFVLVVRLCDESMKPGNSTQPSIYPVDEVFADSSYMQRLSILCRRLLSERLYQAVWIVGVDPANKIIVEPETDLTYEKFLASIHSQLIIHQA